MEADAVAHCGTRAEGAYLSSLVLTDVATGRTACLPLLHHGYDDVLGALDQARQLLPFPLLGLDADNGGEKALGPLLGQGAEVLFAVGLFAASFLGLGTVPLTSAYATCEAFGWETGIDWDWQQALAFYGLPAFFVGFATLFVVFPGLPLIAVMFLSQVLDGLLLPIVLVLVFLLAGKRRTLGSLMSGRILLGWLVTIAISVMSIALVVAQVRG